MDRDEIIAGENISLDDNINTRDMRRTALRTALICLGIVGLVIAAGRGHLQPESQAEMTSTAMDNMPGGHARLPLGFIEPPGKIGLNVKYDPLALQESDVPGAGASHHSLARAYLEAGRTTSNTKQQLSTTESKHGM